MHKNYSKLLRTKRLKNLLLLINTCTLLHELVCNNRDIHANECNKMFIIHHKL